MNQLKKYLGIAFIAAVAIGAFLSLTAMADGSHRDGLGRSLSEAPFFFRFFFGQSKEWAGFLWFLGDIVFFWGGLAIGFKLISSSGSKSESQPPEKQAY